MEAAPEPPRSAREGVVRNGCEAALVRPEREQQVGDAVRGRQLRVRRGHAEAVHALAVRAHEQRAGLAHEPGAELAPLARQAGLALEVALLVAEQVAEQP